MSKNYALLVLLAIIVVLGCSVAVSVQATTTSTAAPTEPPRNWYTAWINGTNFNTVDFQNALQAQFSASNLGVWFVTTYPDPPVYSSSTNGFQFKFCFSSSNVTSRQSAFDAYRAGDATLAGLKSQCNAKNIKLWAIAPTSVPVDTTPSPPVNHQWYKVSISGSTYDNSHFAQCMTTTLNVLANCVIQPIPSDPASAYNAATDSINFTFGFYGEYYARNQDALTSYLQSSPSFTSLYTNCATAALKIKIASFQLTATPDAYTNPPPTTTGAGGNNNADDGGKTLIPGLANWMSFTLIGVVSFAVVGVIVFVILSYCRAQEEGEEETKNVKFDSRKQAQVSAQELAYQRADVQSERDEPKQ